MRETETENSPRRRGGAEDAEERVFSVKNTPDSANSVSLW